MRISLDQPTFLTSLTEEKPANNQTDSGASSDDFLDFSSTLVNQAPEANTTSAEALPSTPVSSDETLAAQQNNELTPEDLTNLLLGMGYLADVATKNAPMPTDATQTDQPLDLTKEAMNLASKASATPEAVNTMGAIMKPSNDQPMQMQSMARVAKPMTTEAAPTAPLPTKPSTAMTTPTTPMTLTTPATPTTPTVTSAPTTPQPIPTTAANVPALPLKDDKKPLELRQEVKELTKNAELLINSSLLSGAKSDSTTKTNVSMDLLPTSTDNTPDQKVVMSLQQMAEWVQAKVNADPALSKGMPHTDTHANFAMLQSQSEAAVSGAATPARAAFEARVEVNQVMSNAELNLTTYHANIKIYPPELGKITAKMKMDKNETTLEITAENKQVKALLQGHLNTLREQFTSSNIQLNKIEIVLADPKEASTANPNGRREKEETSETLASEPNETKARETKTSKKTSENVVDAYV